MSCSHVVLACIMETQGLESCSVAHVIIILQGVCHNHHKHSKMPSMTEVAQEKCPSLLDSSNK